MANLTVGSSYMQNPIAEQWDAIVIGSGIGGLAAAALLAKHGGKRVLVLERHYVAGGFTHSFHRPGYEWDVGVHYIGQVQDPSSPLRRIFDHLTGGRLKWNPCLKCMTASASGSVSTSSWRARSDFATA